MLSKQDMNPQLKQLLRAAALPKSTHLFSQQKPQKVDIGPSAHQVCGETELWKQTLQCVHRTMDNYNKNERFVSYAGNVAENRAWIRSNRPP